jgi:AbrB family looped-hinge helix DNA binding protein
MELDYGTRKVVRRGGSLQITIPATFRRTFKIKEGTKLHLFSKGKVLILEVKKSD